MARVFVLAGQSNMAGAGNIAELPERCVQPPANTRLFDRDRWRGLLESERFGPEIGFAARLAEVEPDTPNFLCKCAVGGANLFYDWCPDRDEGGSEDTFRGPLYPKLMAAVAWVREDLACKGDTAEFAGILWMQGERDAVFPFMAEAYENNLTRFIARLRADLGVPEAPFIIGEISPRRCVLETGAFFHAHRRTVQSAQRRVAVSVPKTAFVETWDLPQGDNLHFDTAGQLELGKRFADTWLAMAHGAE